MELGFLPLSKPVHWPCVNRWQNVLLSWCSSAFLQVGTTSGFAQSEDSGSVSTVSRTKIDVEEFMSALKIAVCC